MADTKEPTSMHAIYTMVGEHDDLIKKDILPMISELKSSQAENTDEIQGIKSELQSIKTEVTAIRSAQSSLELTVLKDGAQTRDLLNRFVDHYFQADGKAFKSKDKVALTKLGTKEKIWLAIIAMFTGGGLATIGSVVISYINR